MLEALPDAPLVRARLPVDLRGREPAESLPRLFADLPQRFDLHAQLAARRIRFHRSPLQFNLTTRREEVRIRSPSVPQGLARLQHVRDALLRLALAAEREEGFAFEV